MAHPATGQTRGERNPTDVDAILAAHRDKTLIRFITCGSVDDGKSTLIGRLLHDTAALYDDELATLAAESRRVGTQRGAIDFALLVDGLAAEREQGITIDVAYRFFATERRKFIVADTPGHEQYTRNMVTGASTAEAAVLIVDARAGIGTQTRRHSYLARLLGIRQVIVAVNKLDLLGFDRDRFAAIAADYARFADEIGLAGVQAIPLSALGGDNVVARSPHTAWYEGPTLIEALEAIAPPTAYDGAGFALPVQWVNRPDADFRGFAGQVAAGAIAPGDAVRVLPSGRRTTVARIVTMDGDLPRAAAGQSVTLTLADAVACSRGDLIVAERNPPEVADQFEATLIWMGDEPLVPGRGYRLKIGANTVNATVREPKYRVNVDTLERLAARTLTLNEIGVAEVATDRPIAFAPYADNRTLGGFILIDRESNATVAAGLLHFALRRAHNIHRQPVEVTREAHAALKGQAPRVVWLTGLSGAGKSTIANRVEQRLHARGRHSFLLDGDNIRHGLNRDLGFTDADRIENVRRVGEVARLMTDAGLIVLAAFISPFRAERAMVRALFPAGEFVEVHVDAPLAVAEARDPKGLYRKARAGDLANFTGIDSPYEPPEAPELRIDTTHLDADAAADLIVAYLLGDAA